MDAANVQPEELSVAFRFACLGTPDTRRDPILVASGGWNIWFGLHAE
jgi:hypothetical protein